jgi:hypothetical protein
MKLHIVLLPTNQFVAMTGSKLSEGVWIADNIVSHDKMARRLERAVEDRGKMNHEAVVAAFIALENGANEIIFNL